MLILASCAGRESGVLRKVLNHRELITAMAMVDEYDKFISVMGTREEVPVEKAYNNFLQFNVLFARVSGNAANFRPDPSRIVEVIDTLGVENVKKFLVFNPQCTQLAIAHDGKYIEILEQLAPRREIYAGMLEKAGASTGESIEGDWTVLDEYGKIDFRQADERFVFLLNVFSLTNE